MCISGAGVFMPDLQPQPRIRKSILFAAFIGHNRSATWKSRALHGCSIRRTGFSISEPLVKAAKAEGGRMIRSRMAFVFLLLCGLVALASVSGQQADASLRL